MQHKEFTERVKSEALKNIDESVYEHLIEPVYYMADSLNKDEFCAIFDAVFGKRMGDKNVLNLLKELAFYYRLSEDCIKAGERREKSQKSEIERLGDLLIKQGFENEVCIPQAELIRRKLRMGMQLTDAQADYVINNLH